MAIGLVYLSIQNATGDDHVMDVATGGSSYTLLLGITCGGVCFYFNLIGFVFVFDGGGREGVSCLFVVYRLTREFSTHMETSQLL